MKILVAGGAGFIGSFVVGEALKRRHDVYALVRQTTNVWRLEEVRRIFDVDFKIVRYSSLYELPQIVEKITPDVTINMAVYYVKHHCYEDIPKLVSSIVEFGTALLDASVSAGVRKFVTVGTGFEYAFEEHMISERVPTRPYDLYAAMKQAFEQVSKFYAFSHGVRVRILKPFFVYGIRDNPKKILVRLICADEGERIELRSGLQQLDYVYVRDVALAIVLAAEDEHPSLFEVFNVGTGHGTMFREVVDTLRKIGGLKARVVWEEGPPADGIFRLVADISKVQNWLGWMPSYSIEDGLREMVEYYRGGCGEGR